MMKLTIEELEQYLQERYGGWAKEEYLLLKLVEEMGEVAEVINMRLGSKKAPETDLKRELGIELADMLHYVVAIAAINEIDLTSIIFEKDKKASQKYHHQVNLEEFLSQRDE